MEQLIKQNFHFIRYCLCVRVAYNYRVDASDLFSTVMEKVWKFRQSFSVIVENGERGSFISWVTTIAKRAALDERRKINSRRPILMELDLLISIAKMYEYQLNYMEEYDRDRILKHIHAVYGDVCFYTVKMVRDGADYKDICAHFKQNKSTLYRRLAKIRKEIQHL